jgi:murein DD-endopeptidase MepM/ murein hydrolase activator NlpD
LIKVIFIFLSLTLYASNIETKIIKTKSHITLTKNKISNMNATLDGLVKQINKQTDILNNINNKISILNKKITLLKQTLNNNKKNLQKLQIQKEKLEKQKENLQSEVIEFISNNYTAQKQEISSVDDLINSEILLTVSKISGKKMSSIASLYSQINSKIKDITNLIDMIKNSATLLEKKKQELAKLKQQQYQKLKVLNAKKTVYKKKLQQLINEQNRMQNQLAKLNIIQKENAKKAREEAKRRAEIAYNRKIKYNSGADKIKVKDYGNVYMKTKTARYRGPKTISPVKNAKIIKKFGAYIDPIYHISLYNDSITFQTRPNEKVRAIFSGKVVFVSNQNNNKMIVIEHKNHLHSIYAKLSKISPFIKKDYRVKKNDIIAKTDGKLEFEVTYKTYPINPLQVINLK